MKKLSQTKFVDVFSSFDLLQAQQVAEGDASNKEILTTSFKHMAESFWKELADFKRDLIDELQAMKQPGVPIEEVHHDQLSHIRMDVKETTSKHSLVNSYIPRTGI